MSRKTQYTVKKSPTTEVQTDIQPNFPSMPRMYLELLENKTKTQQDLINKEYKASPASRKKTSQTKDTSPTVLPENPNQDTFEDIIEKKLKTLDPLPKSIEKTDGIEIKEHKNPQDDTKSIASNHTASTKTSRKSDNLENRLKELLADDDSTASKQSIHVDKSPDNHRTRDRDRKQDRHRNRDLDRDNPINPYEKETKPPPTLAELKAQGVYQGKPELRDISQPDGDIHEDDTKRELLFKFQLLKKSYPQAEIPEFTLHSNLNHMKKTYETQVKQLSLDTSVDQYKMYLLGGCMALEFILGKFLKLDMEGFTKQQSQNIHTYERLLVELGEKSYVPEGESWPVEIRLAGLVIINAVFFIASKMFMEKTGASLMGIFNSLNRQAPPNAQAGKKRMKGPDINIESIPETTS
jgi:hypothetical protein